MSDSAGDAAGDPQRRQLQSDARTAPTPGGDATSAVATDTTPAPPPPPPPTAAPDVGAASVPTLAARPTHGEQEHAAVGTAGSSNGRTVANPFLHAIAVVAFDTDAGQKVETVCPPGALSKVQCDRLRALGLPQSTSAGNSGMLFSFRVRCDGLPLYACSPHDHVFLFATAYFRQVRDATVHRGYTQKSVVLLSRVPCAALLTAAAPIIGAAFFDVGADALRAAMQDAARWPLPPLQHATPLASPTGAASSAPLFSAGADAASGLLLPLLGQVLRVARPPRHIIASLHEARAAAAASAGAARSPSPGSGAGAGAGTEAGAGAGAGVGVDAGAGGAGVEVSALGGLFSQAGLFSGLPGHTSNLWHLWSIIVTGQPLLIMGATAVQCSRAAMAVCSLIAPITYAGDYRPFFTIYDSDFREVCQLHDSMKGKLLPAAVYAVTNPLFVKSWEYWPHMLCLPAPGQAGGSAMLSRQRSTPVHAPCIKVVGGATKLEAALGAKSAGIFDPSTETMPRLVSRAKPLVAADKTVLKQLLQVQQPSSAGGELRLSPDGRVRFASSGSGSGGGGGGGRSGGTGASGGDGSGAGSGGNGGGGVDGDDSIGEVPAIVINNAVLRQHFRKLTKAFLSPFKPYFRMAKTMGTASLGPYDRLADVVLPTFTQKTFLQRLERRKANIPAPFRKAKWKALYTGFITSPNFWPWFNARRAESERELMHISRGLRLSTTVDALLSQLGIVGSSVYFARKFGPGGVDAAVVAEEAAGTAVDPACADASAGGPADTANGGAVGAQSAKSARQATVAARCVSMAAKVRASMQREAAWLAQDLELLHWMRVHLKALETLAARRVA